jgi:hypothetical protein
MNFDIYKDKKFIKILQSIYNLKILQIADSLFFQSKFTFINNSLFSSPLFFLSPLDLNSNNKEILYIKKLEKYSKTEKKNIIFVSMKNYPLKNKIYFVNNPILKLPLEYKFIYNNISKNFKKNLKKNKNHIVSNNIILKKTKNLTHLYEFYNNIYLYTSIKKNKNFFQPYDLFSKLMKNDLIDFYIALKNDKILGGNILLKDKNIIHFNWIASKKIKNISLDLALINYSIKESIKQNYEYFNFGPTCLSDKGLLKFKMRWGCKNYKVYKYYTLKKPNLFDMNKDYKIIRNLYSLIPVNILKKCMPKLIKFVVN